MKKRKLRRAIILALLVSTISIGVLIVMSSLNQNIMFFYTPTEIHTTKTNTHNIRVGGIVKPGIITKHHQNNILSTSFVLTDCNHDVLVHYSGILPSLFREGQGIVSIGDLDQSNVMHAKKILAKHDENYVPRGLEYTLPDNSVCNPKNYTR